MSKRLLGKHMFPLSGSNLKVMGFIMYSVILKNVGSCHTAVFCFQKHCDQNKVAPRQGSTAVVVYRRSIPFEDFVTYKVRSYCIMGL